MEKRIYYAGMALQGLLARSDPNNSTWSTHTYNAQVIAEDMLNAEIALFFEYIKENNLRKVKEILDEDKDMANNTIYHCEKLSKFSRLLGISPLEYAKEVKSVEIQELLIKYGAH